MTPAVRFEVVRSSHALPTTQEPPSARKSLPCATSRLGGIASRLSAAYMIHASWSCVRLPKQEMDCALDLAPVQRGQEHRCQDRNDCDDHEQFDEGKGGVM